MYRFIILLHLISSFLLTKSLHILLSNQFIAFLYHHSKFKVIFLISLVKILCLSLVKLCCVLNINLFFFKNSLSSFLRPSTSISFFLDGLFYFQAELLLNSFSNLSCFFFMTHFLVSFAFLSSLPSYIK